ncbi:unnamed protein product [Pleuronectes platessa]|uniref:Uncharacterized protein n=1 Tax=Pleuronectes platessa TaxID=8262 RepID=A0A9N7YZA0_PLEPL|nr:unnamed protein product [Pleuronectes platessa]
MFLQHAIPLTSQGRVKEKGNKGRQELHFADEHLCRPVFSAPQSSLLPSPARICDLRPGERKTAATRVECRRTHATGKEEKEKNMIVKQHLVFILYSLCASVFKAPGLTHDFIKNQWFCGDDKVAEEASVAAFRSRFCPWRTGTRSPNRVAFTDPCVPSDRPAPGHACAATAL